MQNDLISSWSLSIAVDHDDDDVGVAKKRFNISARNETSSVPCNISVDSSGSCFMQRGCTESAYFQNYTDYENRNELHISLPSASFAFLFFLPPKELTIQTDKNNKVQNMLL